MTNQEMFDTAACGIIQQGGPSINEEGYCAYRGPDGRKCAAGHLIPDDVYAPYFEGSLVTRIPELTKVFDNSAGGLAHRMQFAHDFSSDDDFLSEWKRKMSVIAEDFNLDPSVLSEVPQ